MSHKLSDYDDAPPDEELPSYEDVIKQEAQAGSSSQSSHRPSSHSSHRPSRPPPPGRPSSSRPPPPRPPRPTVPSSNTAPVSNIPWVYPRGFHCPKCNNTGYKTKNGKSCKSCWRRFARQNSTSMSQTSYGGGYQSSPIYPQQQQQMPYQQMQYQPMQTAPARPLYVRPGDPRIGGVVCGNCRGSGRIRFFLDEDICGVCNGLGRIIGR